MSDQSGESTHRATDVVLYAGGGYGEVEIGGESINLIRPGRVPTVAEMAAASMTVVLGPLTDGDAAMEFAGRALLALEGGATVVFCYSARLNDVEWRIVPDFAPSIVTHPLGGHLVPIAREPAPHPAFRVYFVQYGQTDQAFRAVPDDAEVLAHAGAEPMPAAFARCVGAGRVYVLPIHMASGAGDTFHRLVDAVLEHRDETAAELPPFLDALELPGEAERRGQIAETTSLLEQLTREQRELAQHKRLLSHFAGSPLEALVIDELNFVLDGGPLTARDTVEQFVEDFALVDADGAMLAIGEAKATGRHVGFQNVDQLSWHRAQLVSGSDGDDEPGTAPTETPGLLVANVFRNDETLERRLGERVNGRIRSHARRANVLIVRTADLFRLVVRRLDGRDDAERLAELILHGGGGWLEVRDDLTLHTD